MKLFEGETTFPAEAYMTPDVPEAEFDPDFCTFFFIQIHRGGEDWKWPATFTGQLKMGQRIWEKWAELDETSKEKYRDLQRREGNVRRLVPGHSGLSVYSNFRGVANRVSKAGRKAQLAKQAELDAAAPPPPEPAAAAVRPAKDPDRPKKPPSGYRLFLRDNSEEIRMENDWIKDDIDVGNVAWAMWQTETKEFRDEYNNRAKPALDAFFQVELKDYKRKHAAAAATSDVAVPPKRTAVDPNCPKQPKNSWQRYCDANKDKVAGLGAIEAGKLLLPQWRDLSPEEKKPFEVATKEDMAKYKQALLKYRQTLQPPGNVAAADVESAVVEDIPGEPEDMEVVDTVEPILSQIKLEDPNVCQTQEYQPQMDLMNEPSCSHHT